MFQLRNNESLSFFKEYWGWKVAGFYSAGRAPDLGLLKAGWKGCLQYGAFLSCLGLFSLVLGFLLLGPPPKNWDISLLEPRQTLGLWPSGASHFWGCLRFRLHQNWSCLASELELLISGASYFWSTRAITDLGNFRS